MRKVICGGVLARAFESGAQGPIFLARGLKLGFQVLNVLAQASCGLFRNGIFAQILHDGVEVVFGSGQLVGQPLVGARHLGVPFGYGRLQPYEDILLLMLCFRHQSTPCRDCLGCSGLHEYMV